MRMHSIQLAYHCAEETVPAETVDILLNELISVPATVEFKIPHHFQVQSYFGAFSPLFTFLCLFPFLYFLLAYIPALFFPLLFSRAYSFTSMMLATIEFYAIPSHFCRNHMGLHWQHSSSYIKAMACFYHSAVILEKLG